ncbi:MAG TPA: tartrate dehydrogenase [Chloroflexota bacterium]|nr:tartrate dehydrogenase [Chloroflexota bacterium]
MRTHRIAVIAGDGIGPDVLSEGRRVLDAAAKVHGGFELEYQEFPWSCQYYLEHGRMAPPDFLDTLRGFDAIYLGAVGYPGVPDHVSLWELLLPIRKAFSQYVNLRPVRLLKGIQTPLANRGPNDIDFVCVRENTEGEYSGAGGRVQVGTPAEVALQTGVFTRLGVERIIVYAFELARNRQRKKVTSATKSNALNYSMVFWDEVFAEVAQRYPDVETEKWHTDALAARFITHPQTLDVVVASNLFADILTDIGAAIQGSMGTAASANLDPFKKYPSMFEPVHGSAPDIAGQGIANPIGAIWAGAMMLDTLGESEAAGRVMRALEETTGSGQALTRDVGGSATTTQAGQAVAARVLASGA